MIVTVQLRNKSLFLLSGQGLSCFRPVWQAGLCVRECLHQPQRFPSHPRLCTCPSIRHIDPKTSAKLQSEASCPRVKSGHDNDGGRPVRELLACKKPVENVAPGDHLPPPPF
jgi:hypothetical protein